MAYLGFAPSSHPVLLRSPTCPPVRRLAPLPRLFALAVGVSVERLLLLRYVSAQRRNCK